MRVDSVRVNMIAKGHCQPGIMRISQETKLGLAFRCIFLVSLFFGELKGIENH